MKQKRSRLNSSKLQHWALKKMKISKRIFHSNEDLLEFKGRYRLLTYSFSSGLEFVKDSSKRSKDTNTLHPEGLNMNNRVPSMKEEQDLGSFNSNSF